MVSIDVVSTYTLAEVNGFIFSSLRVQTSFASHKNRERHTQLKGAVRLLLSHFGFFPLLKSCFIRLNKDFLDKFALFNSELSTLFAIINNISQLVIWVF